MAVYRGRSITNEEIAFIRQLIADHPELSRWKLSRQLCEAWQWKQAKPRTTEKTSAVLAPSDPPKEQTIAEKPKGHGRKGASTYTGAKKVPVPHPTLHSGDTCPGCEKGKVYPLKEPRTLVRIVGQAPLAATVYELDRLRCNLCGEVFTAPEPEGIGPEKHDDTTAAMIALLKYGSGMPFYRLEKLEHLLGIPLAASTQWEIVEEAAEVIQAARDELIQQAAQGEVLHNDDTSMRVLHLAREPSDDRTGVFTSGIVSTQEGRRIALYFTGRQHAGENLRDVLEHRVPAHLAQHMTTIALTLREDRLGALLVVASSEEMIKRLIRNRQASLSPVEALYSRLFVGRKVCDLSPQLVCNAAALDGAVVIDGSGIVRGIGCIFETGRRRTAAEGARTRAALFASKGGLALKISQDGEISIYSNGDAQASMFAPVW